MLMAVSAAAEPWLRHTIDNSSLGADGARSADVNGDGLPDLVTGWEQGGVSRIYLMQREGVAYPTWQMIEVGAAPSVEDALLVDLDQDGAIDVVSSTEGKNRQLLVHWAPSDAERYAESTAWRTETLWAGDKQWMYAISMDIDGQHGPDLVVGAKGAGAEVGWLESPADSRQLDDWKFHRLTDVTWTMSLFARDMDGDGIRDVVVSDRKGEREGVFWLRNPGADSAHLNEPWRKIWIADDLGETTLIDVADREGDGRLEIVVPHMANETDGALTLLKQSPHGDWHRESIAVGGNKTHPKSATVADVNQDGRADIVLSFEKRNDPAASGVIWLEQTSTGWVAHDISGSEGIKFDLNLVIDIDGDGDLDVVNTEENNNAQGGQAGLGLVWYENPLANVPRL
ncbi:MAG: hypothetical protein SynsKO_08850 [Synoicihabitans sp.]